MVSQVYITGLLIIFYSSELFNTIFIATAIANFQLIKKSVYR